ncbi:MAG: hypothetical protein L0338_23070 [Acidobacteria bacterium]|nr:hypothetical protein [Acidobacteriota bacterium]
MQSLAEPESPCGDLNEAVVSFVFSGFLLGAAVFTESPVLRFVCWLILTLVSIGGWWMLTRPHPRKRIKVFVGLVPCMFTGFAARWIFWIEGIPAKLGLVPLAVVSLWAGYLILRSRQRQVLPDRVNPSCLQPVRSASDGVRSVSHWRTTCERIAHGLRKARERQFESAVRVIDRRFSAEFPRLRRSLGGEADSALRGFQHWITCSFLAEREYVPWPESLAFFQELDAADGHNSDDATPYATEFEASRDNPPEQCARLAFYMVRHIVSVPDARAAALVGTLVPFFVLNTQAAIADAFGDRTTHMELQGRIDRLREMMTSSRG